MGDGEEDVDIGDCRVWTETAKCGGGKSVTELSVIIIIIIIIIP